MMNMIVVEGITLTFDGWSEDKIDANVEVNNVLNVVNKALSEAGLRCEPQLKLGEDSKIKIIEFKDDE